MASSSSTRVCSISQNQEQNGIEVSRVHDNHEDLAPDIHSKRTEHRSPSSGPATSGPGVKGALLCPNMTDATKNFSLIHLMNTTIMADLAHLVYLTGHGEVHH